MKGVKMRPLADVVAERKAERMHMRQRRQDRHRLHMKRRPYPRRQARIVADAILKACRRAWLDQRMEETRMRHRAELQRRRQQQHARELDRRLAVRIIRSSLLELGVPRLRVKMAEERGWRKQAGVARAVTGAYGQVSHQCLTLPQLGGTRA